MNKTYTPTYIDGKPYAVMLPTGGNEIGEPNQWDAVLSMFDRRNDLLHYENMFSWCQETDLDSSDIRLSRGEAFRNARHSSVHNSDIGFRPILVPLNPDAMSPDSTILDSFKDGSTFCMGTLYMDGLPRANPQLPTRDGDIPDYTSGSNLRLGDSDEEPYNHIQWIKAGDILIADRNLLKNVSWDDLDRNGLAFGDIEKVPDRDLEEIYVNVGGRRRSIDDLIREALRESRNQVPEKETPPFHIEAQHEM